MLFLFSFLYTLLIYVAALLYCNKQLLFNRKFYFNSNSLWQIEMSWQGGTSWTKETDSQTQTEKGAHGTEKWNMARTTGKLQETLLCFWIKFVRRSYRN